jgi:hypothetical protein
MSEAAKFTAEVERAIAVAYFNEVWQLLELSSRTAAQDDRMLHLAHASRLHWDNVGTDQHRAIGEWQCSRVYSVLGRSEPALFHAQRCLAYASTDGVEEWVAPSGYEALSRAYAVSGDVAAARDARDTAIRLLATVSDEDDKAVVQGDLDTLPPM